MNQENTDMPSPDSPVSQTPLAETTEDSSSVTEPSSDHHEVSVDDLMKRVLPINLGALFMPAIWGPAHGLWITILFYPFWIFADNIFYSAFSMPNFFTIGLAVIVAIFAIAVTVVFAKVGQKYALVRALQQGKSLETYKRNQVIWAIAMAVVAIIFVAVATWYNLTIHPTLDVAMDTLVVD